MTSIADNWTIFSALLFVFMFIIALYMMTGRGGFLVAGYNTLSKKEKEKYDEKALCVNVGRFLLMMTILMVGLVYSVYAGYTIMIYFTAAAMVVLFAGFVYYMNKNRSKFLKK